MKIYRVKCEGDDLLTLRYALGVSLEDCLSRLDLTLYRNGRLEREPAVREVTYVGELAKQKPVTCGTCGKEKK